MAARRERVNTDPERPAARKERPGTAREAGETRKLIAFDADTWEALRALSRDSLSSIQELADEAFRDLLKKHNRPVTLKEALRASVAPQTTGKRRKT